MLKRTPLFSAHAALGARLVEFGGWEMPVQYTGIIDEHQAVRQAAGVFDISHMGEVMVAGPGAAAFLNHALTNDVGRLAVGQAQYSLLCTERGGVVDDLYVYRVKEDEFLLIINASRIEADWDWLQTQVDHSPGRDGFSLKNVSAEMGAIAVQGPKVADFIDQAIPGGSIGGTLAPHVGGLKKNEMAGFVFQGTPVYVARTGYTGEDGFEVVSPAALIPQVWEAVLEAGRPHGIQPAGLGARDTLRTEVCYPLYGHELDLETSPIEAGLGYFVALDKGPFVGRAVLADQKANGVRKRCVAFTMSDKGAPPRPGYPIWAAGSATAASGRVVSGTLSPSLGMGIGLGYVPPEMAVVGTALEIEVRGRRHPAKVVRKPFFRRTP
ncbi:MAG: glycine cleavage system aminomethyltransferase GcvT [Limisphaerales bacterium]